MTRKTDREISAALHEQIRQQVVALRRLAQHAPMRYIREGIEQAASFLESADTCWKEEEQQAGQPFWS